MMALNVKAALTICGLFIAGLCYLVDQVALPVAELAVPVTEARFASPLVPAPTPEPPPQEEPARSPKFAQRSPVEAFESPRAAKTVAAVALPQEEEVLRPKPLPSPQTGQHREAVVASASSTRATSDWPVALMATRRTRDTASEVPEPEDTAKTYEIRKGDSLIKIARRFWGSDDRRLVDLLIAANPQLAERPNTVYVGEPISVPSRHIAQQVVAGGFEPVAYGRPAAERARVIAARSGPRETRKLSWYTIRKRDSLASIARRFLDDAGRWREIAELNNLREPDRILPGMRIKLPVILAAARG